MNIHLCKNVSTDVVKCSLVVIPVTALCSKIAVFTSTNPCNLKSSMKTFIDMAVRVLVAWVFFLSSLRILENSEKCQTVPKNVFLLMVPVWKLSLSPLHAQEFLGGNMIPARVGGYLQTSCGSLYEVNIQGDSVH